MNTKRNLLTASLILSIVPSLFGAAEGLAGDWGRVKNEYHPYPIFFGTNNHRVVIAPGQSIDLSGWVFGRGEHPEFYIYNFSGAVLSRFYAYPHYNYVFTREGILNSFARPRPEDEERGAAAAGAPGIAHGQGLVKDYNIWLASEVDPSIRADFQESDLRQMWSEYVKQQLEKAKKQIVLEKRIIGAPGGPMIEE